LKNLTKKVGNGKEYLRIAVRDEADNAALIEALKEVEKTL
jgi:histidinol-phosphate/aromatic aminotransferase/cobyric acid decarboxylase-like protein